MDDISAILDGRIVADGGTSTGSNCDYCGSHVSQRFYDVFATEEGLYACPSCGPQSGVAEEQMRRLTDGEYDPAAKL